MQAFSPRNKIIKSFCVVGLNPDKLLYYNDKEKPQLYINNIDILKAKFSYNKNIYKKGDEVWYRVFENGDIWFRIDYTKNYNNPITDFKIIGCKIDESGEHLIIDKRYSDYNIIKVTELKDEINLENKKEIIKIKDEYNIKDKMNDIPKEFNIKEIMKINLNTPAAVIAITRKKSFLPLKRIQIKLLKDNQYQFRKNNHISPFLAKYNPEILDQYPRSEEINNSVSMFCFPIGIYFLEKQMPPTKFSFVLTDESGERTYCSVLIFWEELNNDIRRQLEPKFEEEVEKTEEEIKNNIYKDKKKLKKYYAPKALCILSKFPFFSNNSLFLKYLYKIFTSSSTKIPLERAICGYVNSLYKQSYDNLIRFNIDKNHIDFYFIPNYGKEWDINDLYLETLFRVLSIDIILIAWQGLLLEKKLYLICSSKETLLHVSYALITLLFPFKWIHTYIPILPEKLRAFTQSPMPLIFGIPFSIDLDEIPDDGLSLIININKDCLENNKIEMPKLTGKLKMILDKRIKNFREKYMIGKPERTDIWMDYLDAMESKEKPENLNTIDCTDIREIFYDVFIHMFKNYDKYFNWKTDKNKNINDENNINEEDVKFKREIFLKDHGSNDDGTFLSMFCDTVIFNQFIKSISIGEIDGSIKFFFECIKKGRDKNKPFLLNTIAQKIVNAPQIEIDDLKGKEYFYPTFPKLDENLFINYDPPKKPYKSKFIFQQDEWCYYPAKLKGKDWPKYLLYLIYEIWYEFFSFSIHFYEKEKIEKLMDFAIFLLEDLINKKKIIPTRNLFSKMFKSCGRNELSSYLKQILSLSNKLYKKSGTTIFQNAYLNGFYTLVEHSESNNLSISYSYINDINTKKSFLDDISSNFDYNSFFESFLFFPEAFCPFCSHNIEKIYFIKMEELLAGFNANSNKLDSICPNCLNLIPCNIYYLNKNSNDKKVKQFQLLRPDRLIIEIDDIIKTLGEYAFYSENFANNQRFTLIYLNIIFYFKLFDLPLFVLYIERDQEKFQENIIQEIKSNINRKNLIRGKALNFPFSNKSRDNTPEKKSSRSDLNLTDDNFNFTEISTKTNSSNGKSNSEIELWKNVVLQIRKEIKLTGDKIGTENKTHMQKRIKYMKLVISDLCSNFACLYKEKLNEYFEKFEENSGMKMIEKSDKNLKSIYKARPPSVDFKRIKGLNDEDIQRKKTFDTHKNDDFNEIINGSVKEDENIKNIINPNNIHQINQLNNSNNVNPSKRIINQFRSIFSKK